MVPRAEDWQGLPARDGQGRGARARQHAEPGTVSTLRHVPVDIIGCALPSQSTFGLKNAKVMGFEFAQLGGEPKYLVKLPELSESGATMSPCYAKCSRRALRNAHEIAFVELLASALLTRAQGLANAARQQGMLIWLIGDGMVPRAEDWQGLPARDGQG